MKKLEWCFVILEFLVFFAIAWGIWSAVYELKRLNDAVDAIKGLIPI